MVDKYNCTCAAGYTGDHCEAIGKIVCSTVSHLGLWGGGVGTTCFFDITAVYLSAKVSVSFPVRAAPALGCRIFEKLQVIKNNCERMMGNFKGIEIFERQKWHVHNFRRQRMCHFPLSEWSNVQSNGRAVQLQMRSWLRWGSLRGW